MLRDFIKDLNKAKQGEHIVYSVLSSLYPNYSWEDVSDIREYRYRGDIRATDKATGQKFYFEVKDDSRIAETANILCEEENYLKETDRYIDGGMRADNDYYCVLSQKERKIYIFDFKILQQIYKQGSFKDIEHADQITYCYLLPIGTAKKAGALKKVINYGFDF